LAIGERARARIRIGCARVPGTRVGIATAAPHAARSHRLDIIRDGRGMVRRERRIGRLERARETAHGRACANDRAVCRL